MFNKTITRAFHNGNVVTTMTPSRHRRRTSDTQWPRTIRNDRRQVAHTQEVLKELEATESLLKDAALARHRYAVFGDERLLEPYDAALGKMPSQIRQLRTLTPDSRVQQRRLDAVAPLIAANLAFRTDAIKALKAGHRRRAIAARNAYGIVNRAAGRSWS